MKVTLLNHTVEPVETLLFTKQTRLAMTPGLMEEIRSWPQERKLAELQYMARTIRSSWEFIDFTFLIEGVTRAIAQQITRTRTASYAMQSLRVVDAADIPVENPFAPDTPQHRVFDEAQAACKRAYSALIATGAPKEDARGVLPLNTTCTLVAKYNLRTLADLIAARSSLRAQGPYAQLAAEMKRLVLEAVPEFECFFADPREEAFAMLEAVARDLGITPGAGPAWEIAKAIDLLRKEA